MQKKKAVVVGATSGIGMEVARLLAEKGWQVGVAGRRVDKLETLMHEVPGVTSMRRIDVMQEDAPEQLMALVDEMGGMDLYFHSSGIGYQNVMLDEEKEISTALTNGVGFTRMVTAAFNYFVQKKNGHIAAISSIAGTRSLGAAPAYSSTKRYQNHYLGCLRQLAKMRGLDIHLTDVRPGFVATDLIKDDNYPLKMTAKDVAHHIVKGVEKRKKVMIIDWKYRIVVWFWRLIPEWLWVRLPIKTH